MSRFARFGATLVLGLSSVLALSGPSVAAAAPTPTCTAELVIFTTSPGVESQTGPVLHFRDSGVGGQYTSGFLAGYTLVGAQDIQLNTRTNGSELQGQFVATGPGGSLAIAYTGHADLNTGAATGHFHTTGGTGQFSDFRWEGDITAQLIGPATFHATDTGPCRHGAA